MSKPPSKLKDDNATRWVIPEETHPRASQLGGSVVAAQQPKPISHDGPYADTAEYLEQQIERLRAALDAAIALAAGDTAAWRQAKEGERALGVSIAERVRATEAKGIELGLETLRRRFELDDFEVNAILHAVAPSLDTSLVKLYARLAGATWRMGVDVGLVAQIHFEGVAARLRARSYFLPSSNLLRNRLLMLDRTRSEARESLLACELKLPPRIAGLVLGREALVGAAPYSSLVDPDVTLDQVVLPDEIRADLEGLLSAQPQLAQRLEDWGFNRVMPSGRGVVVLLTGPSGTGKSTLARALAQRLGKRILIIDAPKLLEASKALDEQADDLFQEARLQDAVVFFDECEFLFGGRSTGNRSLSAMLRAMDRFDGLVILATNLPEKIDPAFDRRVLMRISLEVPPPALRKKIWECHLPREVPLASDVDIGQLAKRYDVSGGYIRNAILLAVSRALARPGSKTLTQQDLDSAAQAQLRGDISSYAERTHSNLSLDMLILPEDVQSQIVEIISAGRNRSQVLYGWGFNERITTGKGLVVLLSGDPGTGKTLSAEVIAAELGMSLYRINPAKVVSKFVGETEKNLNEILAQAKSMHAILFFDEADALFSSRVAKVETANDRFVNMETNFLLQQLERYDGIVILATNLETSIDHAFKRRIHYHVTIPFPDPPARALIWQRLLPARAPLADDIDFSRLGRTFELAGGHIKNAVMRAAYLAAQRTAQISMALLAEAAEKECAAAGKLYQHVASPPAVPRATVLPPR